MTIVVAARDKDGVKIGADQLGVAGLDKRVRKDPKVFVRHGIKYGFTSSYRMGQILRYHSEEVLSNIRDQDCYGYVVEHLVPMWRRVLGQHGFKRTDRGEELGGFFLVVIDGRIFQIEPDFQVGEAAEDYDAVGCGASYALGCLYALRNIEASADDMIKSAIEAAKNYSAGCGGDPVII
jgi:ATP-dependent protease HslVU (ClpYQ) peptidase subunit